ncbi:MAG: bifunctional diaminohydroxyphosphoribosylaminopyrimidine deaminase/5-amino-6-(5-phosphoribosylamino)uracil reductase RibD [Betaproteobacteria bacterium]|nr:MAG: bifunctional diaminohydroxyphosphoribosylaminopyrimidine deaminase/5-amino-6-(5-phosphoribosylamino)uracil reductase RibD [Betaproteobacteria bacterium]
MSAATDRDMMTRALVLAERGLFTTTPNPRVGCVIARDSLVLGEGWHERAGGAHAEVRALDDARAHGNDVRGATAYVTLEPCNHQGRTPPCTSALFAAGIKRVVAAMSDPDPKAAGGADRLKAAGVTVETGLFEDEARELNVGWLHRLRYGRPWIRVKVAASLDGRTALENGASQWITGEEARADGHRWRARACAILTGIGTVRQDDPRLTVRAIATPRQPLKVVVDRHGDLPAAARILDGGDVIVVTATKPIGSFPENVQVITVPDRHGRIDLPAMAKALGEREINELHVEAGAKLNGAMLAAGIIDELLFYIAPCLLGDPARGMFALPAPLERLADRVSLKVRSIDAVGGDWRVVARVEPESA